MDVRAEKIQKILDDLYPNPEIPLKFTSNYTVLIATMLSAQCTDTRVNMVTPVLFAKADTPCKMVKLSVAEIEIAIHSCGLAPTKAYAVLGMSRKILECHSGEVPDTFEELEALPGVGHKTASVVMLHAFGKPAFPVDTHIHRCAKRWGLSSGKSVVQTERDLKKLFPRESWGRLHLQIIIFGRKYCKALRHNVVSCPICSELSQEGRLF